jgi:hypothetical protein
VDFEIDKVAGLIPLLVLRDGPGKSLVDDAKAVVARSVARSSANSAAQSGIGHWR